LNDLRKSIVDALNTETEDENKAIADHAERVASLNADHAEF